MNGSTLRLQKHGTSQSTFKIHKKFKKPLQKMLTTAIFEKNTDILFIVSQQLIKLVWLVQRCIRTLSNIYDVGILN